MKWPQVGYFGWPSGYKRIPEGMANSYLDEMGVFCMSEVKDQILMWAHYSEGHTGFCLEFSASSTTPFFGRAQKIKYREKYGSIRICERK